MRALVLSGLLVSIDNLQVTTGVGLLGVSRRRRWLLVVVFAFCEATMPLVGVVLGLQLRGAIGSALDVVGPLVLAGGGLAVLWSTRASRLERHRDSLVDRRGWKVMLLPVALSFDNLLVGAGLGSFGYPAVQTAVVVGVMSGAMCAIGLTLGTTVRRRLCNVGDGVVDRWGGLVLFGSAVLLFVGAG